MASPYLCHKYIWYFGILVFWYSARAAAAVLSGRGAALTVRAFRNMLLASLLGAFVLRRAMASVPFLPRVFRERRRGLLVSVFAIFWRVYYEFRVRERPHVRCVRAWRSCGGLSSVGISTT